MGGEEKQTEWGSQRLIRLLKHHITVQSKSVQYITELCNLSHQTLVTSSSLILSANKIFMISSSLFLEDRPAMQSKERVETYYVNDKYTTCTPIIEGVSIAQFHIPYRRLPSLSQYIFLKSYLPPFFWIGPSSPSLSLSKALCCHRNYTKMCQETVCMHATYIYNIYIYIKECDWTSMLPVYFPSLNVKLHHKACQRVMDWKYTSFTSVTAMFDSPQICFIW